MLLWVVRALLAFALGLVVFLALAGLLLSLAARSLLDGVLYARVLDDQDFYERIYVEGLTPQAVDRVRPHLADGLTLLTGEELVELIRAVAPPEYLQGQMEANLGLLDAFLAGESDSMALYVDLAEPMDRMAPAIARVVEPRILGKAGGTASSSSQVPYRAATTRPYGTSSEAPPLTRHQYAGEIEAAMASVLTGGAAPATMSVLSGLTERERLELFDRTADAILNNETISLRYRESLGEARPALREVFRSGATYDLLSAAMKAAAEPAIELALADTRSRLDEEGRIDLLPLLANNLLETDEPELQAALRTSRDSLAVLLFWGTAVPLLVVILAIALAGTVFWGRIGAIYHWLYLTLTVSGAALFAITLAAYLTVPVAAERAVIELLDSTEGVIPGLPILLADVAAALVSEQLGRLIWTSGAIALAGAALGVAGYLARRYSLRNLDQMLGENGKDGPTPG